MLFTRIGVGSKMILCGDMRQKLIEGKSGLEALGYMATKSKSVAKITLINNYRDPIVAELLDLYEEYVWNERQKSREDNGRSRGASRSLPEAS